MLSTVAYSTLYLCLFGSLVKGVESNMQCYVCGPGDDEEGCADPIKDGLLPVTCLSSARTCSVIQRGPPGAVTYLSRQCADTCRPQQTDALQVQCCQQDACNQGNTTLIFRILTLLGVLIPWIVLFL